MANRFSGKSSFNKLSLLVGVPLKSIQVNEWNKKIRSIGTFVKKKRQLNFESENKRHKSRENPNLGLPRVHMLYNCLEYLEASKVSFVCVWICKLRYLLILISGGIHTCLLHTIRIIFLNNSNNKSNQNFWLIFHIIWISNAWP